MFSSTWLGTSKETIILLLNNLQPSKLNISIKKVTWGFLFVCFYIFSLNLLGWHWLIRFYRFQVYISMIHDLYIALCLHLKPNHPPSPWIRPPLPFTAPRPLPSGNHHTVVCVYECQFYIPHMNEIIWFLVFADWHISLSTIFSGSIYVVANGSISSFPMTEQCSIVYVDHIFFIQPFVEGHFVVDSISWPWWTMLNEHRSVYI